VGRTRPYRAFRKFRRGNHDFLDQLTAMGKGGSRLRGEERDRTNVRTVAVTVMRRHFLAYCDRLDHAEGDIAPLAEEFTVIVAVMLSLF
jgi:hypothetical protein